MSFSTNVLTGERIHVKGTDADGVTGETVLDSSQWTELQAHRAFHAATDEFDAAVEAFFAPLNEAAAKAEATLNVEVDPLSVVVLHEGSEGKPALQADVVSLTRDSQILRLLESGDTSRLRWVNGELEVLARTASSQVSVPVVPTMAEVTAAGAEATSTQEAGNADASGQL